MLDISLVFQIPWVCRCLDPQTPPEVRPLGGPNTDPHKVFGGFWKTRVCPCTKKSPKSKEWGKYPTPRFFPVTQTWLFYSWPLKRVENVTSIWAIKRSLGRSWSSEFDHTSPKCYSKPNKISNLDVFFFFKNVALVGALATEFPPPKTWPNPFRPTSSVSI